MKKLVLVAILHCLLFSNGLVHATIPPRILMIVDQGYRPEEYFQPRKLFDRSGFLVQVAALYPGTVLPSRPHLGEVPPIPVDVTVDRVLIKNYDAIVFVGGNGAWNEFLPNPAIHRVLYESLNHNKITGLICAATGLLATAGNLNGETPHFKGKHVTGYFEVEGLLRKVGEVDYDAGVPGKPFVVTDGNLITGRDPISAELFGETIVNQLKNLNK